MLIHEHYVHNFLRFIRRKHVRNSEVKMNIVVVSVYFQDNGVNNDMRD